MEAKVTRSTRGRSLPPKPAVSVEPKGKRAKFIAANKDPSP
jgi:hypothetical protein